MKPPDGSSRRKEVDHGLRLQGSLSYPLLLLLLAFAGTVEMLLEPASVPEMPGKSEGPQPTGRLEDDDSDG